MILGRTERRVGLACISVLAALWLVPIAMMLAVSFMPPDQRAPKFGGLLIQGFSLHNYLTVFHDAPIVLHFINSLVITVSTVALVVLFGSLAAYAFARMPIFQIDRSLGLTNNYLGLILPYTALGTPFAIIILRSFFESLPRELEEAA